VPATALTESMPQRWQAATRHPFLQAIGAATEGSDTAFALWMAQDVVFVRDLIAFQARLVARAPREAQRVLAEGVVGLLAELDWFDDQAAALQVDLGAEPAPATLRYRGLLERLDGEPYPVAVVGLWTLERVYLDAWRYAGESGTGGRYAAALEHWTEPGFAAYVVELERAADAVLAETVLADTGPVDVTEDHVRETVRDVLDLEIAFWDMAWPA
jgi:thiaminase